MKGIVFTELIEMIENEFSFKIADDIIQRSNLKSKGVYSSIGTYDHQEIFILVKELSDATGIAICATLPGLRRTSCLVGLKVTTLHSSKTFPTHYRSLN